MPEQWSQKRPVCVPVCVTPLVIDGQKVAKHVLVAMNRHTTIGELLDTSFSKRSMSYQRREGEGRGNGSVNTFPRKQRIAGHIIFSTLHVVPKESK
jgi:hypothetical protein